MRETKLKDFMNLSILAIDYGTKVIGTAKYTVGVDPYPLMLQKIIVKSENETINELKKIIEDESIDIIVIGIPYFVDGKESEQTKTNKIFADKLKKTFSTLKFFEQDETLTTKEAEERMINSPQFNFKIDRTKIDCMSAVVILEDFLSTRLNSPLK